MFGTQCLLVRQGDAQGAGAQLIAWLPPELAVEGDAVVRAASKCDVAPSVWTVEQAYAHSTTDFTTDPKVMKRMFVPTPCACIAPSAFRRASKGG